MDQKITEALQDRSFDGIRKSNKLLMMALSSLKMQTAEDHIAKIELSQALTNNNRDLQLLTTGINTFGGSRIIEMRFKHSRKHG